MRISNIAPDTPCVGSGIAAFSKICEISVFIDIYYYLVYYLN